MSGGAAASDGGGAKEKHDDEENSATVAARKFITTMMQRMFGHVLHKVHGRKFFEGQPVEFSELMSAIRSCTGAILTRIDMSCHQSLDDFDAFCEQRKMVRYTGFHGTTVTHAKNICENGVDSGFCKTGRWGKGFYVANSAQGTVSLMHADTDDETITSDSTYAVVVCVVAGPPSSADMFVGSDMQEDFGILKSQGKEVLDADGRPYRNHLLTDPSQRVFCVKADESEKGVCPRGIFEFEYDLEVPPTDAALLHSWYPCRLWQELEVLYPGTRARSVALKKKYEARQRWKLTCNLVRKAVRADFIRKKAAQARLQFALRVVMKQVRAQKWTQAVRATHEVLARQLARSMRHSDKPVTRSQARSRDPH